jgi:hypothetical protein
VAGGGRAWPAVAVISTGAPEVNPAKVVRARPLEVEMASCRPNSSCRTEDAPPTCQAAEDTGGRGRGRRRRGAPPRPRGVRGVGPLEGFEYFPLPGTVGYGVTVWDLLATYPPELRNMVPRGGPIPPQRNMMPGISGITAGIR